MKKDNIIEKFRNKFAVFALEKRRLDCLTQIIMGLMVVQTVTLAKIATFLEGTSSLNAKTERIERFIREIRFDESLFAKVVLEFLRIKKNVY